ncbi:MAG: hypothetical protein ACT4P1_15845 [Sporichthyaceae bacterium]
MASVIAAEERIAARGRDPLATATVPAQRLVAAPPPAGPRVGRVTTAPPLSAPAGAYPGGPASFVWLSVHGGAGGSSLARAAAQDNRSADPQGMDLTGCWPDPALGWPTAVVLVCRTNAAGFTAASRFLHEWAADLVPDLQVLALAAVADSPRRLTPALRARLFELSGAAPHVVPVPWIGAWRETPHAPDRAAQKSAHQIAAHIAASITKHVHPRGN